MPLPDADDTTRGASYPFRLIEGERVIASYPIASVSRPLGRLVSFLFVTDSRVVYAAESKNVFSSSTTSSEFKLEKIEGIEASRHRGLDALGAGVAVAIILNAICIGIFGTFLASVFASIPSGFGAYESSSGGGLAPAVLAISTTVAIASIVIGAFVVVALARPRGYLGVLGPKEFIPLAADRDWVTTGVLIVLILLFGPLVGIALLAWGGVRALGVFRAADAFLYASSSNIDVIAFDAGAVILDAQARGSLSAG
ncbi:hypothetical protein [Microbacterium sp. SA39]|uniref:hypothetical protein n=1 Tax=Microbacterium sp. SA39 TaxID=1263625 RepID=UPI00126A16E9|nr:hypothetical protein [Microbacterium sp. SA39]